MADPRPAPKFVEAGQASSRSDHATDLLDDASRRLKFMGVLATAVMVANFFVVVVVSGDELTRQDRMVRICGLVVVFLGSALVFVRAEKARVSVRQMTIIGAAFVVSIAFAAGLTRHMGTHVGSWTGTWSGIAVAILLFPVLIPSRPRSAIIVGLAATAADLAGYGLALVQGRDALSAVGLLDTFSSDLIAIPVAFALSHVVRQLEDKVLDARKLGSYVLEEKLGVGGMGEVWRGRHARLARPAAIKLIKSEALQLPDAARTELLQRFEREAQVTATLRSPHTVEVYDFGLTEDGIFYYVMEFLEGVDLYDAVADGGAFTPARTINVLMQACESLAEAHEAGLVHRDIKPSNIFFADYGGRPDFVKVLDFGLVKDHTLGEDDHSVAGTVMGTPAFMPPEQARGLEVDARSDVYALGCVAFWLLTSDYVFGDLSPIDQIVAHTTKYPRSVVRTAKQPVPKELGDLIAWCLAKEPDARPDDARVLAKSLAEIEVEHPWRDEDARAWWTALREP